MHGIAALCYDPIGQGERCRCSGATLPATTNDTTTAPGDDDSPPLTIEEHTLGGRSDPPGSHTASYHIYDGMLDYLASRPDIDARRLGCTGNPAAVR
jgi:hypothetical protein